MSDQANDPRWVVGEPRLRLCFSGRWLAISDDRATVRIAVEGESQQDANQRFYEAMTAWKRLWEERYAGPNQ